ncbi:MAG TPA: hypothetical protein V6D21_05210 [Candidatus Obscuribacterales bacterium]
MNHQIKPFSRYIWQITYQFGEYVTYTETLKEAMNNSYFLNYADNDVECGFWTWDSIEKHCKRYGYARGNYDVKKDDYWWEVKKVKQFL